MFLVFQVESVALSTLWSCSVGTRKRNGVLTGSPSDCSLPNIRGVRKSVDRKGLVSEVDFCEVKGVECVSSDGVASIYVLAKYFSTICCGVKNIVGFEAVLEGLMMFGVGVRAGIVGGGSVTNIGFGQVAVGVRGGIVGVNLIVFSGLGGTTGFSRG